MFKALGKRLGNPVSGKRFVPTKTAKMAVVLGTWSFSFEAVKLISDRLREGSECLDALESGVNGNQSISCFY